MLHSGMKWSCFIWKGVFNEARLRRMKRTCGAWSGSCEPWSEAFSGFMFFCLGIKAKKWSGWEENRFPIHNALISITLRAVMYFFVWSTLWSSYCSCDLQNIAHIQQKSNAENSGRNASHILRDDKEKDCCWLFKSHNSPVGTLNNRIRIKKCLPYAAGTKL